MGAEGLQSLRGSGRELGRCALGALEFGGVAFVLVELSCAWTLHPHPRPRVGA